MKRSRLKRKTELKANPEKPLRPDPEKVREFLRRGRESGSKSLRAAAVRSVRAGRPAEGPLDPATWRQNVFAASAGRCIVSGSRARDADDRRFHAHHMLPKGELRARGLFGHVWDDRNGILVSQRVHMRHEGGYRRIPRELLPARVWAFAKELDELDGTSWATSLVERLHPSTAAVSSGTR